MDETVVLWRAITNRYRSFRPLWEVVAARQSVWWWWRWQWRRFKNVARSGTTRSRHRDHGQPLIYILSTGEPASRLFVLECLPRARRGAFHLRFSRPASPFSLCPVRNSVQIPTPVLSTEPPTSISSRAQREGVGVMHSHFSNGDTLSVVPSGL